ncbi:MAG: GNAT family N-acetyltransferase [Methanotrichaceae archaeon]|nr:GNAT family N-acetyltransferase [Methanotrichaceae archaeon]
MSEGEVSLAIEWAAEEGWNPGVRDSDCLYAADPHGFLVGIYDGLPVSSLSAVSYGPDFGFLGLFIVNPAFRGHGLGQEIFRAGLARLDGKVVGLDAVLEQEKPYSRWGFERAHLNVRYQGWGGKSRPASTEVVALSKVPLDEILAYDDGLFPAARHEFVRCWISRPGSNALAFVDDGEILGYGVMRPCRLGYKIGPLFADAYEVALAIFQGLRSLISETEPVFLDLPLPNGPAVELAQSVGMVQGFQTVRMYNGKPPDTPLDRWFGVTSFGLG